MRCTCCNRNLSDYESTLRHAITREFLDTCNKCLDGLDIPTMGRPDLAKVVEADEFETFSDFDNDDQDET